MKKESIGCFLINLEYVTEVVSILSTFLSSRQFSVYVFVFIEAFKLLLCSLMEATFDMYEVEQ